MKRKRSRDPMASPRLMLLWSKAEQRRFIEATERLVTSINRLEVIARLPQVQKALARILAAAISGEGSQP